MGLLEQLIDDFLRQQEIQRKSLLTHPLVISFITLVEQLGSKEKVIVALRSTHDLINSRTPTKEA